MTAAPVRCTAPHPDHRGRSCDARLTESANAVSVVRGSTASPGSVVLKCWRCGATYVVTAKVA